MSWKNLRAIWRERRTRTEVAVGAIVLAGLLTLALIIAALTAPKLQADLAAERVASPSSRRLQSSHRLGFYVHRGKPFPVLGCGKCASDSRGAAHDRHGFLCEKPDLFGRLLAAFFAVIGSGLSKVVALVVLAPFIAASLVNDRLRMPCAFVVAALIAAAATVGLAAVLLYMFGSYFFILAPPGPESLTMFWSRHTLGTVLPVATREIAAVVLAGTVFLLTDRLRASAIAFGFLLFFAYPFLFYFDFIGSIILLDLVACDDPERLQRHRVLVLGALLLALPAAVLTDLAGTSSGIVWLLCVGGVTWAAMPHEPQLVPRGLFRAGVATSLRLCVGLFGVARGNVVLGSGWEAGVLTPSVRGMWLAVRERTPVDALIFTDQTGTKPTLLSGWNTYAIMGGRQIFVSSIYTNRETRMNRQRALDVLGQNDAVLQGKLTPEQLPLPAQILVLLCRGILQPADPTIVAENFWQRGSLPV